MSQSSRICSILFDVEPSSYQAEALFWSGTLGKEISFDPKKPYTVMRGDLRIEVQEVPPEHVGVHVDIETDDVDAEVSRLEKLGAVRREKVRDWWVMVSPGGHPFCIIPVQSESWPKGASKWD